METLTSVPPTSTVVVPVPARRLTARQRELLGELLALTPADDRSAVLLAVRETTPISLSPPRRAPG